MATVPPAISSAHDWVDQAAEAVEDLDEPPEPKMQMSANNFQRSAVPQPTQKTSLLSQILAQSDDDDIHLDAHAELTNRYRRSSMKSNISIASTADLTSDTGFTSPSRASTPSPPLPEMTSLRLSNGFQYLSAMAPRQESAPRKRCIQFACAAKPQQPEIIAPLMAKTTSAQEAPRRPCVKFACQARPASTQNTPPSRAPIFPAEAKPEPSTPKRGSALSTTAITISPRPSPIKKPSDKGVVARPRFLRATSTDLIKDGSQFHEFAIDSAREDDWIRHDASTAGAKLTINDTLTKENRIRRLANEVEEEAQLEEEEAEEALDEDDEDDDEEEDDDDLELDEEDEEDDEVDGDDENDSDGYHTDEETGFADSDEEDEEDENMILWTPGHATAIRDTGARLVRRSSINEQHSDSSIGSRRSIRRAKARPIGPTAEANDLPDSTDFVCGTLDEDKPLEEVFMSCLNARRNEKLRLIPQDIDPSFPASDPEDEDEGQNHNAGQNDSDHNGWIHGAMEDLHHDQDRSRRRKSEQHSPRRLRSPAPKRHFSPPPKSRARSPKPLFDRHSPRRARSPAPKPIKVITPSQTPRQGGHIKFHLAGRPGLTQTKSLPRPPALFPHKLSCKGSRTTSDNDVHVRGAIDIVKGLEKKRQRRREKFHQKYCNRARRGQIPERKTQPGIGAERMKELGLVMAGKKDQGNYVLSF